ncbi:hypothetical protein F4775DRAFT_356670 [Biscogniauxia sp. FL1348]|nr:hypothetical protein F4775DRAFT_356670 [Biscogniauxia sp. FL1348]
MATSTVAAVVRTVCLLLGLASVLPLASADDATTSAMQSVPEYLTQFLMTLSLIGDESVSLSYDYSVAPLTGEAGLNQSNQVSLSTYDVQGRMTVVDTTNFNTVSSDVIAFMSCDSNAANSFITPNDMLNTVMSRKPQAILLFSTGGSCCSLGGSNLVFSSIWTMTSREDAWQTKNITSDSNGTVLARIAGNDTSSESDRQDQQQGGNNSAVAMSILYSITGLITLLFLIIIATGAIRAHRHPERYGPRASVGGRPRQSRAKGLARAVLETLPIVKFGDTPTDKSDPENELDSVAGDRHSPTSQVRGDDLSSANDAPSSSAEATSSATAQPTSGAVATAAAAQEHPKKEDSSYDHLGCSICTEDFTVGEDVRVLPCNHKFHPTCVDPWLVNVSGTCPLCRLDLRPHEETGEGDGNSESTHHDTSVEDQHATPTGSQNNHTTDGLQVPSDGDGLNADTAQRRRRSRLLDWNRLRHASVDERIQALRQYRQSQQGLTTTNGGTEESNSHPRLTDRVRERLHLHHRAPSPGGSVSPSP